MRVMLDASSVDDYRKFLRVKSLPKYRIRGCVAEFPDEHSEAVLGVAARSSESDDHVPPAWMFDYQRDIVSTAVRKRKFSVFADCGLGKTAILLEFARVAASRTGRRVLIVSPLMVVEQTCSESARFYDGWKPDIVRASGLPAWLTGGSGVGITNYEAIRDDLPDATLGGLILDESSMLKSHYGSWGTRLLEMGRGVEYKMCLTGTPAPNDRIEYANHAVFMDAFPTVNAFLARYFVNRGETSNRWELKPHATAPFYRSLADWSIFLSNPSVYGWSDNARSIPPIRVHVHDVSLTAAQRNAVMEESGSLFVTESGGIGQRSRLARIGKGFHGDRKIDSRKTRYIAEMVASWDESTIVWCRYNAEQDEIASAIDGCESIDGQTPHDERLRIIDDFKAGRVRVLVTKPKILGFGLNLQVATRQVFSTLQDSYEEYYQAVKRSNRVGSTKPLDVHIPITEIERPMLDTVLRKAKDIESDTRLQEALFRDAYK